MAPKPSSRSMPRSPVKGKPDKSGDPEPKYSKPDSGSSETSTADHDKTRGSEPAGSKTAKPKRRTQKGSTEPGKASPTPSFVGVSQNFKDFATELNLGISSVKREVEMKPLTNGYMQMVDQCYTQIIYATPQAATYMTRAQWNHCHRLIFARRLEDVRFAARGVKPSAATRVPLPKPLRVFQPLWDCLAAIGITVVEETSTTYVPVHPLPSSPASEEWSEDYLLDLIKCSAFDWETSWTDAQHELDQRVMDSTNTIVVDRPDGLDSQTPAQLQAQLKQIKSLKLQMKEEAGKPDHADHIISLTVEGHLVWTQADGISSAQHRIKADFWPLDLPRNSKDLISAAQTWKKTAQQWRPRTAEEIPAVKFDTDGEGDLGAYGANLGWSPQLWVRYNAFVDSASVTALFSLSMPNESLGTFAWVAQWVTDAGTDFCKLPIRSISTPDWIMALLLRFASWDAYERTAYTATWNVKTDPIGTREMVIIRWIRKSIKSSPGVTPTWS